LVEKTAKKIMPIFYEL
jgi:hypothetical protein